MTSCFRTVRPLAFLFGIAFLLPGSIRAQESIPEIDPDVQLTQPQLDQLLGPIALYPDALVALILPASTMPTDIVLAARYLNAAGTAAEIDGQPWNDSVKSLARYPEIIKWMDENLAWTQQMGSAFVAQPSDVMTAVQRLRARARATGALVNTPQQQVVDDEGAIEIVPAQPDVIYVPRYDPDVVYVADPDNYGGSYVTFGYGFPTGYWLSYDLDWRRRSIWVGDRYQGWYRPGSPGRPNFPNNPNWHPWRPPVHRPPSPPPGGHRPRPDVVRPRPFPGTPPTPHNSRPDDRNRPARPDVNRQSPVAEPSRAAPVPGTYRSTPVPSVPAARVAPPSNNQPRSAVPANPPMPPQNRPPQVKATPSPRVVMPPPAATSAPAPATATPPPASPPTTSSRGGGAPQ